MTRQLTAAGIKKINPGKKRREIRDANSGLSVIIHPSGQKTWIMRFRRPTDGRQAKLTLGPVDLQAAETTETPEIGMPLSLKSARWLAADVNRRRAMGKDVIADLARTRRQRQVEIETEAYTYPAAVRQFVAEYARGKNRGWRGVARMLGLDYGTDDGEPTEIDGSLATRWGDRAVSLIDGHDIFAVVDEARRHGVPGLRKRNEGLSDPRGRLLARALSKFFAWLLSQRKVSANPCLGMFVPASSQKRSRVLTAAEIAALWHAAEKIGYPFGPLVKLLLLTGTRRCEAAGVCYPELSEDGHSWIIDAERVKNKRDFLVPLVPQVRDLIAEASKFAKNSGNAGLVFTTTGMTAVSGFSRIKRQIDELMRQELGEGFKPWRIHDVRRTVSTGMSSIRIPPHVVEAVLNHVSGFKAGVAGVYNVYEYEPEKREALEKWACHLDLLLAGKDRP